MYVEKNFFFKAKIELQDHQVRSISSAAGLALIHLLIYCFYNKLLCGKIHMNHS